VLSPSRCHRAIAYVRPHESTNRKLLLGRSSPRTENCLYRTGRHIFSSAVQRLYIGWALRHGPAKLCKGIQLKSAYTASFRQLKSAIVNTALMYVRRPCPCTVAHGLSVRKGKERIAKKRYTAPMSNVRGGGKEKKEKKRKEKKRKERRDQVEIMTRTREAARISVSHPTKPRCALLGLRLCTFLDIYFVWPLPKNPGQSLTVALCRSDASTRRYDSTI